MFKKKTRVQSNYNSYRPHRRGMRRVGVVLVLLVVLFVVAATLVRHEYYDNLNPVSTDSNTVVVTIADGTSTPDIASLLKKDGLIRSIAAFEWYVNSHGNHSDLQAGTYVLRPNMSTTTIVDIISSGKVATNYVTIYPQQRLSQIRASLIQAGFTPIAVNNALNPALYTGYSALADKPAKASLEGFLYPDTFQKNADTSPQTIIQESLTEMGQHLTPDIRAAFAREGLSVYKGVTLASIVEQEVNKPADRAQAAQVFLSRLKNGMTLGSDVTAFYGAHIAGEQARVTYNSPYNTLIHHGLPPGPISNVSDSSLKAVAYPAHTHWLFFVTGDNKVTYFSKTAQEHDQQAQEYCHKLCSAP